MSFSLGTVILKALPTSTGLKCPKNGLCNTWTVAWYWDIWNWDTCPQKSSLMSGFKYFCHRSQTTFWFCMQPSVSKYCDCTEFRYHLQELPLQPGPFVSILYILYTAETAEPPIIVLIVINWQMIRRNDTNFRFGQTSALHDAGEECPCSWWVGATLQLDILHSLR